MPGKRGHWWGWLLLLATILAGATACEFEEDEEDIASDSPAVVRQVNDESFAQARREEYLRNDVEGFYSQPPQPPNVLRAVTQTTDCRYAGGDGGLYVWDGAAWQAALTDRPITCLYAEDAKLFAGTIGKIIVYDNGITDELALPDQEQHPYAVLRHQGALQVGTEDGLFTQGDAGFTLHSVLREMFVFSLAIDAAGALWVGTSDGLYRLEDGRVTGHWTTADYLLSSTVTSLATDEQGRLWIGTDAGLNMRNEAGTITAFTGQLGLPVMEITALAAAGESLWIATARGLILRTQTDWRYFAGRRWLPDDETFALNVATADEVWIATGNGLSQLIFQEMTLSEKAAHYRRLTRERHLRFGLATPCDLDLPGDLSTYRPVASDRDGLQTSLLLAALSLEYAVNGEELTKQVADEHFAALLFLETVTDIPGLPARSVDELYSHSLDPTCAPLCQWQANDRLGFDWNSDTDAEEITARYFALALYHDLAADEAQRAAVAQTVARLTDRLLANDYFLIDWDGEPTTWGVWNPTYLWAWYGADDPQRALETFHRVLPHSLELLMFLRTAHHLTGEDRYLDAYHRLIRDHSLDDLAINAVQYLPIYVDPELDLMCFLSFATLLRYESDSTLRGKYIDGIGQAWTYKSLMNNSLFNLLYGASLSASEDFGLPAAVEVLRDMPLDLVDWRMENSQRADVNMNPWPNRYGQPLSNRSLPPLPPAERAITEWNEDPYVLDAGGGGTREKSGVFWLLAYWLGRYHGFITEPQTDLE